MDLYKRIMSDKGSDAKNVVNNKLSSYILEEKDVKDFISTNVISLNLLASAKIDGGIPKGMISMFSAPSKLGKTLVLLSLLKNAQKKGMTCIVIDSEYCFDFKLAKAFGIDTSKEKLIVLQESSIHEIKNMISKIFDGLEKEEINKIFLGIDSWGAMITTKVVEDAKEGKTTADLTEARTKNELAKVIAYYGVTTFVVNHVYSNVGGWGDPLKIPGGTKIYHLARCVLLGYSRKKEKEDKDISAFIVKVKTDKSNFSMEGNELEFRIKRNGALDIFYGILNDAIEGGYVKEGSKRATYIRPHIKNDDGVKEDNLYSPEFWLPIFKGTDFKKYLENKYSYKTDIDVAKNNIEIDNLFKGIFDEKTKTAVTKKV